MIKYIQEDYHIDVVISVNILSVQIIDPSFVQMVKSILEETKVSGSCLELEVTESVFITSMEYVIQVIDKLKKWVFKLL
nr:EAL domain-containing protein [[Clostridium] fimetarium]